MIDEAGEDSGVGFRWYWLLEAEAILAVYLLAMCCIAPVGGSLMVVQTEVIFLLFLGALVCRGVVFKRIGMERVPAPKGFQVTLWIVAGVEFFLVLWVVGRF